jgi:glutaminase
MNAVPSAAFVSTGELPPPERVRLLVADAHKRFTSIDEGRPSQVYPALARASPELFGICVVGARGGVFGVGDADVEFTIMSVAKPFVFALVCATSGPEVVRRRAHDVMWR